MTTPSSKNSAAVKVARMTASGAVTKPARYVFHAPHIAPMPSPFDWRSKKLSDAEAGVQAKVAKQARLAQTQQARRIAAKRLLASTSGAGQA